MCRLGLPEAMGTMTSGLAAGTTGIGAATATWLAKLSGTEICAAHT